MPSPPTSGAPTWRSRSSGSTRSPAAGSSASDSRRRSARSRRWRGCWSGHGPAASRLRAASSTSGTVATSSSPSRWRIRSSARWLHTSSGPRCTTASPPTPGPSARPSSSSTRGAWSSASPTSSRSGSARGGSPRITAAWRGGCGSTPRNGSSRAPCRWWSRRRRSSSASTSGASTWCATSARRVPSRRSSSASAAPATRAAPCRAASSSRSRATTWSRLPLRCVRSAPASSTASACPRTPSTSWPSSASPRWRRGRSASRSCGRWCAARTPFAGWRATTSTPWWTCWPTASRPGAAGGGPPTIPFWLGEAPARTRELSAAVSALRAEVGARLGDRRAAAEWLAAECGLTSDGAEQIAGYLAEGQAGLGALPTQRCVVAERFFDEAGGMQLVVHAPFGGRINRAWGYALRKRFCVTFDFELQAAATDDGFVLSLGPQHSFPLDGVFDMVRRERLVEDLTQAMLAAPMFTNRWRWNATRALALLRFQGGRRVPMPLQRMRADDLLAAVFPAQAACADNATGPIVVPDHPLVRETLDNCLHEAMDTDGLDGVLADVERGAIETRVIDTAAPSVLSHEMLHSDPYTYLDDAPLEERRARAVALRRMDPDLAGGLGALDAAAIAAVRAEAWPEVRDADELHDVLSSLVLVPDAEIDAAGWTALAAELVAASRATRASDGAWRALVAAERVTLVRRLAPAARFEPEPVDVLAPRGEDLTEEDARRAVAGGWLECTGPITAEALAARTGLAPAAIGVGLAALERAGVALRGRFTPGSTAEEWCERGLLARIHRLTLARLRREIEPVSVADLMRFLFRWQHLETGTQLHGRPGLLEVIGQLQGLDLPARASETP